MIDAAGRVLIAQRPAGKPMAGGWEFPGGKLEPGEARAAGLARELQEEIGIAIAAPRPLMRVRHSYPRRDVLLDMWVITRFVGEPQGLDGQTLRWCTRQDLAAAQLLPADGPIVPLLWLPERLTEAASADYRISGLRSTTSAALGADLRLRGAFCRCSDDVLAAAGAGADFLVMGSVMPDAELAALCASVVMPVYVRGPTLEEAWQLGASGVHEVAP